MGRKSSRHAHIKQATLRLCNERPALNMSFTGESLSHFGGLPLAAKIEKLTGLIEGAAAKINDHRTQSLIDYNTAQLLKQCVFLTATGNPDTNDADIFGSDPALLEALELANDETAASQASISRFLNSVTKEDLERIADWLLEFYIRQHPVRRKRIYLYADGTAVETYGKQEGAVYRAGKYKKEMYFPLTIFDQDGWLLTALLRPGYKSEAKTILEQVEKVVGRLRQKWPGVEIVLVVDGAFKSSSLLNWCENNKVFYLAGYSNSFAVQMMVKPDQKKLETKFKKNHGKPRFLGKKGKKDVQKEHTRIRDIENPQERMKEEKALARRRERRMGEAMHRATTWPKTDPDRRLIYRLDYTDTGLDTRCILTNFDGYTAEKLYEMYCRRGASENWIGELKNCGHLRFNSQSFRANQFRLQIHGLAYMLLFLLRRSMSADFQSLSLETLRKTFITITTQVKYKSRLTTLWALDERFPFQTEFLRVARKLERAS